MKRGWSLAAGAAVVALLAVAIGWRAVYVRSQAELTARHPMPPSAVHAASRADALAEGRRLAVVTGCTFCHGEGLAGPTAGGPAARFASPNLTLIAGKRSDGDLDRAIRFGLNADGTSELAMPSFAYASLSDAEVADLIGYLRSLKPTGRPYAPPPPSLLTRLSLVMGGFKTQAERRAVARPPLDAGPAVEAGRHLAAVACGQCHGSDLAGGRNLPGPDITVRGYFSRDQFHTLMQTGDMPQNVHSELMQEAARASLKHLTPAEADAIYDYLTARDAKLSKAGPAPR